MVVNPIIDGHHTFDADDLAKATHSDSHEQNVTEINWGGHRSWIIRCGPGCGSNQQAQISGENLPAIAAKLNTGNWIEFVDGMPVVPLGVLSYLTDPRKR